MMLIENHFWKITFLMQKIADRFQSLHLKVFLSFFAKITQRTLVFCLIASCRPGSTEQCSHLFAPFGDFWKMNCSLLALFGQYEPFALFVVRMIVVRAVRTIWLVGIVRCSHWSVDPGAGKEIKISGHVDEVYQIYVPNHHCMTFQLSMNDEISDN